MSLDWSSAEVDQACGEQSTFAIAGKQSLAPGETLVWRASTFSEVGSSVRQVAGEGLHILPMDSLLPATPRSEVAALAIADSGALPLFWPSASMLGQYEDLRSLVLVFADTDPVPMQINGWTVHWIRSEGSPPPSALVSIKRRLKLLDELFRLLPCAPVERVILYSSKISGSLLPYYQSTSTPLLLGPEIHPELQARGLLEATFWRVLRENKETVIDKYNWILNGLSVLVAENIASSYADEVRVSRLVEHAVRDRMNFYFSRSPLGYSVTTGPADAGKARGWARQICPLFLSVLLVSDASEQSWVLRSNSPATLNASVVSRELLGSLLAELLGKTALVRVPEIHNRMEETEEDLLLYSSRCRDIGLRLAQTTTLDHCRPDASAIWFMISEGTGGYFESCGCAVSNDGGSIRRNYDLKLLREDIGDRLVAIDLGNMFSFPVGRSPQGYEREKQSLVLSLFRVGGYDAVVPTPLDVAIGGDVLELGLVNVLCASSRVGKSSMRIDSPAGPVVIVPLANNNWSSYEPDSAKIASAEQRLASGDPLEFIRNQIGRIEDPLDNAIVVVVGQISPAFAEELLFELEAIDVILSSDPVTLEEAKGAPGSQSDDHNRLKGVVVSKDTIAVGQRFAVFLNANSYGYGLVGIRAVQGEIVHIEAFDHRLPTSGFSDDASRSLVTEFHKRWAPRANWRLDPILPDFSAEGSAFVGSEVCAQCHFEAYKKWGSTKHSLAFNTLVKVQRDAVPECVLCHVVGLGEPTGWTPDDTPEGLARGLRGVGCESCHGAGSAHCAFPTQGNIVREMGGRCAACHDTKHSPEFEDSKESYRNAIRHW